VLSRMESIKYLGTGAAAGTEVQTSTVYKPSTIPWLTVIAPKMYDWDVTSGAVVIVTRFAFS
jgi:hypothetical protein